MLQVFRNTAFQFTILSPIESPLRSPGNPIVSEEIYQAMVQKVVVSHCKDRSV